jgi:hypothetical protein
MRPLPHFHLVRAVCIALGILCAAGMAHCQDRWYRASLVAVGASQAADVASSWGGIEANPRLGAGKPYGWKATGIKSAVVGGGQAAQYVAVRRHPRWMRVATIVNFALAGATTTVAVRNWRIQR